jgi:hypothetical protein
MSPLFRPAIAAALMILGLALLTSCATLQPSDLVIGPGYQPSNVHSRTATLPKELRRVAVLPVAINRDEPNLESGRQALQPVLLDELHKLKRFEVQPVSAAQVQTWTAKPAWSAADRLPPRFFDKIKEELGCDAVLFCELTTYRAYPPLAVGWNLRLIDGGPTPTVWSVDEVFDAGNPAVANAARRHYQQQEHDGRPLADSLGILSSPRRFGQYAARAVLETLPGR